MKEKRRTKVLVVRLNKERIGLFNALVDGAGRLGICRTRSNKEGVVDIISPPDTFEELKKVVSSIGKFLGDVEVLNEMDWDGKEDLWR